MNGTPAIHADELGKRYGKRWGLRDCSLELPAGRKPFARVDVGARGRMEFQGRDRHEKTPTRKAHHRGQKFSLYFLCVLCG